MPSNEHIGRVTSCQTGVLDPKVQMSLHTTGNFSIMFQPRSAIRHAQDLERALNHLPSPNMTKTTAQVDDKIFYCQKAEDLWRATILLHKDFATLNVMNNLTMVLNRRTSSDQTEAGMHPGAGTMNRKRKRTPDYLGNGNRVKPPTASHLGISSDGSDFDPSDPGEYLDTVLISMCGLASVISTRRQYVDAEQRHHFTLKWPAKLITSEDMSVLTGMHDLAKILIAQDKDEEAEELLRLTVELMEKELELDDLEVMNTIDSLALILTKRGKQDEAEAAYRKTLKMKNKVLMWDDPETEETLGRLNVLLKNNGKLKEAAELRARYRLPAMIKTIMLSTFPRGQLDLHVGLIDDHHDDDDVQAFLKDDSHTIDEIEVFLGDESAAVELLLDPEDLRMVVIVSQRALVSRRQRLENVLKHSLQYGMGDWRDLGIDSFVCYIDQDERGNIWGLPHHLDL